MKNRSIHLYVDRAIHGALKEAAGWEERHMTFVAKRALETELRRLYQAQGKTYPGQQTLHLEAEVGEVPAHA